MKMRWFTVMASAVVLSMVYASCSKDEDSIALRAEREQNGALRARDRGERSGLAGSQIVIDFSDFAPSMMAGPTSYGENYYSATAAGNQVTEISNQLFKSTVNSGYGGIEFWNGGIALSHWNYRSNPTDDASLPNDWWYSYKNQMSVYNTSSADGSNANAGRGDNNFGVVFGYVDSYNQQFGVEKPSFSLKVPMRLQGLWICNSSYTYGVMKYGNTFGNVGVAQPLEAIGGYFKVILECYDENNSPIATYSKLLADYRPDSARVEPVTTWSYWSIGASNVKKVKFNFEGSDSGDYGLNTPAYICIDDIELQ